MPTKHLVEHPFPNPWFFRQYFFLISVPFCTRYPEQIAFAFKTVCETLKSWLSKHRKTRQAYIRLRATVIGASLTAAGRPSVRAHTSCVYIERLNRNTRWEKERTFDLPRLSSEDRVSGTRGQVSVTRWFCNPRFLVQLINGARSR